MKKIDIVCFGIVVCGALFWYGAIKIIYRALHDPSRTVNADNSEIRIDNIELDQIEKGTMDEINK